MRFMASLFTAWMWAATAGRCANAARERPQNRPGGILHGWLIAKRITEIPGSSEVLECGIVSYSNRIKEEVLGVSPATIETYGVISAETAAEMAAGALRISGAEIGLGVTGLAGPDGDDHGNPAGLAFIALTDGAHTLQRTVHTGRGEIIGNITGL